MGGMAPRPRFRRPCRRVASDGEDVGDQTPNADVSRSDFIGFLLMKFQNKKEKNPLPSQKILFSFDSCLQNLFIKAKL